MSRLFGVFTHASGPVTPLLKLSGERCRIPARENRHGYGMGYAQAGDVLLQRRPQIRNQDVDIAQVAADIRSNAFLAHVRRAEVGALKFENTQPFRFGPWLYAQIGTLPGSAEEFDRARALLPDSVARNVAGETDAELFFHLFLARLNDEGISPRLWSAEPPRVSRILGHTLTAWRMVVKPEERQAPLQISGLLTNGQSFFAVRQGPPLWLLAVRTTPRDFQPLELSFDASSGSAPLGTPAAVLLVDGPEGPPGAVEIPQATVVFLDRDFKLTWHPAEL